MGEADRVQSQSPNVEWYTMNVTTTPMEQRTISTVFSDGLLDGRLSLLEFVMSLVP